MPGSVIIDTRAVPTTVMAGEGPPSTTLLLATKKVVDADLRRRDGGGSFGKARRELGINEKIDFTPAHCALSAILAEPRLRPCQAQRCRRRT
jgi:hypothetical protein